MKKYIFLVLSAITVIFISMANNTYAVTTPIQQPADPYSACNNNSSSVACQKGDVYDVIQNIINILLSVVGVIGVVMVIIGGLRFTTSAGNPDAIKVAKNTILYAIIGIVVSFSAWALVTFVIDRLQTGTKNNNSTQQQKQDSNNNTGSDTTTSPDVPAPNDTNTGDPAPTF